MIRTIEKIDQFVQFYEKLVRKRIVTLTLDES